ncbi:hypothetical protein [uncultured Ruminococcus sp.]|uniref:hypothetical protein n=1 Tax=uncultured Ruminococcus sp. TaxID=165186 RepID=UPI0025E483C0|nr:hypothetical protein [uncultured Ruminococcus sp.]
MTTEITRKQAILLAVLGVLFVLVCYVQFLIKPMLKDASGYKEEIQTLQTQYDALVQQGNSYDQNMTALEGWKEKNSEETKRLFPLTATNQVDRFMTFVIRECGATITNLSISSQMQYYMDAENNLVQADPKLVDAAREGTADGSNTTTSSGSDIDAATVASYMATGEYTCDYVYTIEGNYEDIVQLVQFVNGVSFLQLQDITFNSIQDQNLTSDNAESRKLQDYYSFTMTITAYMYKDPLAKDTESEEEVPGTENMLETTANTVG